VKVYLDSSTVLRVLLRQRGQLSFWGEWEGAHSSEVLSLETRRTLDRLHLESVLDDQKLAAAHEALGQIEETIGFIPLTRPVLRRAALPMPTAVKTLDAIHLASAMLFQESRGVDLLFATHDAQQALGARALGFHCRGV
jgi:predicted nucleic acid-binding protein